MTKVLSSARHVAKRTEDVKLNFDNIEQASTSVLEYLQKHAYDVSSWQREPLHIDPHDPAFFDWIFFVSMLNFSFWSELDQEHRFAIRWRRAIRDPPDSPMVRHSGYASLLAAIARAREEGIDITNPAVYATCSEQTLRHVFRSDSAEEIPLFDERLHVLHTTGHILNKRLGGSFKTVVELAQGSAVKLAELIVLHFDCFRDETTYQGDPVFIWKRAQICVAETWAALQGQGLAKFDDIDQITMFADYRVPQILSSLGIISYSDALVAKLRNHVMLEYGSEEEGEAVSIRCLSILAVEELRQRISARIQSQGSTLSCPNAVILDFALWNLAKQQEATSPLPHHRTRSIFY